MEIDPNLLYLLLYELQNEKRKNRIELKREFMDKYWISEDEFDKIESYWPRLENIDEDDFYDDYDDEDIQENDNDYYDDNDNDFDDDFWWNDFEADVGLDY
jgi:hypothetical protein